MLIALISSRSRFAAALKKLNVQPITGVEECNMFMENGNVLHFSAPKGKLRFSPSALALPAFFEAPHN